MTEQTERDALEVWAENAREIADLIVRDVAELPDRTSPVDWPEAMLVTAEELHAVICQALAANRSNDDAD